MSKETAELLEGIADSLERLVPEWIGGRPLLTVGIVDLGPLISTMSEVVRVAAADVRGEVRDDTNLGLEARGLGFVVRDIRRMIDLVNRILDTVMQGLDEQSPSGPDPEVSNALRRRTLQAIAGSLARYADDIETRAGTDGLTGLPRREPYERASQQAVGRGESICIAVVDLDDLKKYNTEGGYSAGDRAIADLASSLVGAFGETCRIYRWGGDEFVILTNQSSREELDTALTDLRDGDVRPFSYGIAEFPNDASDERELWAVAEDRLKQQKQARKDESSSRED